MKKPPSRVPGTTRVKSGAHPGPVRGTAISAGLGVLYRFEGRGTGLVRIAAPATAALPAIGVPGTWRSRGGTRRARPAIRRFGVSLILLTAFLGVPAPASAASPATTRASVASDGTQANSESGSAAISADGRYVAFESPASNLVPGDTNSTHDVFVHDRDTGGMERVSVASDGSQASGGPILHTAPAISADGRHVAFHSYSPNLVPGDTNSTTDVFVRDRVTATTDRISVASDGTQADDQSLSPAISGDGRYVAFQSFAPNLVPGDTNNDTDVFVRDRLTGSTEAVAVAGDGTLANRESVGAAISADGRYVAFISLADNLVPGDTNDADDVFVRDRVTGSTERVSAAGDGTQANNSSGSAEISADGRYVSFISLADNLVPGDTRSSWDVFVHDRVTEATERISVADDSSGSVDVSADISADGRYVAFQSRTRDVFVHDRATESTERVSVASDGLQTNDQSFFPVISGDGRYVAFESNASNLVPGDTNGLSDVFVRDRQGGAPNDTTAPTVAGTSPAAGATGVAVAADVTVSFSEAMDASTVTSATFTLKTGATTVPAAVSYNSTDRVATLNPSADLAAGTTYTATISTAVKDLAGNALAADKTWTFTTAPAGGGTTETVTLTATADSYVTSGATGTNFGTSAMLGVDNSPVEVAYVKFDLSAYAGRTIQSATLQLRSAGSGSTGRQNVKVAGDSWTEGGITYSSRPALGPGIGTLGPTTKNTSYSVPLTVSGLTSELGQELSLGLDSSSSDGLDLNSKEAGSTLAPRLVLTLSGGGGGGGVDTTAPTVAGTSPAAGATGVAVAADVTVSFSEAMDASTVTSATCTLKEGTTTVPAGVTYNSTDRVATLNPAADLAAGTTYTATISTGVKDVAGNALASPKTWTFTTAPAGGGTTETVTLTATADSYVTSATPGTNFGTSAMLGVDNSPVEVAYLKFDLSAYAGRTIQSATLQLRSAGSGSTGSQNVKVAGDNWTETGITYNSGRPALGTSIGTLGPTTTNTNYNVSLNAAAVNGELGQQLSLGMDSSSSDGLDLNSKEAGSTLAPRLVLTLTK